MAYSSSLENQSVKLNIKRVKQYLASRRAEHVNLFFFMTGPVSYQKCIEGDENPGQHLNLVSFNPFFPILLMTGILSHYTSE